MNVRAPKQEEAATFGSLLRGHRLARKLSQETLAGRAGLSVEAISALERGFRRAPQRSTIALLAAALELGPKALAELEIAAVRPSVPRALRSAPEPATFASVESIPIPTTPTIGRRPELAELEGLLETSRLITILGTGGIGKTRIASELARAVAGRYTDGVAFVELASFRPDVAIASVVARALGINPTSQDGLSELVGAIGNRHLLLVLDNCEHVIEGVSGFVAAASRRCPRLTVLTTSRQPLGITGETAYRLPRLAVPEPALAERLELDEALGFASITLFVERAREADPSFHPVGSDIAVIAEICRRLDGVALAIELAATRTRSLSVRDILTRLNRRFRLLATTNERAPRQQTLRALVDWSYDLLSESERRFFTRLAVFAGGFTLDAARAVAGDPGTDEYEILDLIDSLVAKSLVVRATRDGESRFALLETMREYGLERLESDGELAAMERRHLAYFRDLFVRIGNAYRVEGRATLVEPLDAEIENMLTALDRATRLGEIARGSELLTATPVLVRRAMQTETIERATAFAGALDPSEDALLARLWNAVGLTQEALMMPRAKFAYQRAAAHARRAGQTDELAIALVGAALANLRSRNIAEASVIMEEAVTLDARGLAALLLTRGRAQLSTYADDRDEAVRLFGELARLDRARGDLIAEASALSNLAEAEFARGNAARAIEVIESLHATALDVNLPNRALRLSNLAGYRVSRDELALAREAALESLELRTGSGQEPYSFEHLALVLVLAAKPTAAATVAAFAVRLSHTVELLGDFTERSTHDRLYRLLDDALLPEERAACEQAAALLDFDSALALAREAWTPPNDG